MSTLSRRNLLLSAAALSPLYSFAITPRPHILAAADLLSQESAAGYRTLFREDHSALVLIGDTRLPSHVQARVLEGATLIRELPVSNFAADHLYIRYRWPVPALVRVFGIASVSHYGEPIAHLGSSGIAWRRRCGRGTVITLASLLGPHLLAGDREAIAFAQQLAALRS